MKRLLICAALFCALTLLTACDNIDMPDTVGTHTVSDPSASSGDTQLYTIEGQYLATRTGHMVIHGGEPYTISAANDKVEFSSLTDGDIIRVTIDGICETYPGQVTAYSVEKLSDGERSDISDSLLDNLTSMGWLATPSDKEETTVVISNNGSISINTVLLPLTSEDTRITSFPFDDRYTIFVTYDIEKDESGNRVRDYNVRLYIVDVPEGDITFETALDTEYSPDTVTYEGVNICKIYSHKDINEGSRETYNTYTIAKSETFKLIKGELATSAPKYGMPYVSPDGKYTACEVTDDGSGRGGIMILTGGVFTRVLENVIYDGDTAVNIADVKRYVPMGFISDTRLAYKIIAWEGSGGYGFYDVVSGENLEVRDGQYHPAAVNGEWLISTKGGFYDDEGSFEEIVMTTPGLTEKRVAFRGDYYLPEGAACRIEDELWLRYDRTVTESGFYVYNDVTVYKPFFKEKLAELTIPSTQNGHLTSLLVCGASMTYVVPTYEHVPEILANELLGVQYIRTNGYNELLSYPRLVCVTNVTELADYYNAFKGIYYLDNPEKVYSDTTIGWLAASEKYTDEYFSAHDLYLLVLEEGSGSVRHEITGISNGVVTLKRHVPEVVTDDMAEWHIFIEVNKGETLSGISDGNRASRACDVYTVSEVTAALDKALDKTKQQYRNLHSG